MIAPLDVPIDGALLRGVVEPEPTAARPPAPRHRPHRLIGERFAAHSFGPGGPFAPGTT